MNQRHLRSIVGSAVTTAVLYNIGFLSFFFALPLQLSAAGGRRKDFLTVSILSSAGILVFRGLFLSSIGAAGLVLMDTVVLFAVIGALYLCNFVLYGYSMPVRMGLITVAAGVAALLLLPFYKGLEERMIASLDSLFSIMNGLSVSGDPAVDGVLFKGETVYLVMKDFLGSTVLALYFFFISYSWWSGNRLAFRLGRISGEEDRRNDWDFPDSFVWLLFIPLTVLLAGRLMGQRGISFPGGPLEYLISNLLLIMGGLYGIKGIGIIGGFLRKWNIPRQFRVLFVILTAFLIAVPGVNLVVIILIAGLGVSELWVNYRIFDKE